MTIIQMYITRGKKGKKWLSRWMYVYIVWIWFLEKNYDIRNWKWGTKQLVKKEKKKNNKEEEEGKKERKRGKRNLSKKWIDCWKEKLEPYFNNNLFCPVYSCF